MNTPTPQSYNQILGVMIDAFKAKQGIAKLKVGGPILSIFEAVAQGGLRTSKDIFDVLNSINLDYATGTTLQAIGNSENTPIIFASRATSKVTISDSSFSRIATGIYQGLAAPIIGSSTINVTDATLFPATGKIYLGSNTLNYEGPLAYTSKVDHSSYWTLTLSTNTAKFHNLSETVLLAQGGTRTIGSNVIVSTVQSALGTPVSFKTQYTATILDGETEVDSVGVIASVAGTQSNIPANAIQVFVSPPFVGAIVTNPLPVSNAQDTEDDDTYRDRIKATRKARSLGTSIAITNAVVGRTSSDDDGRITSATIVGNTGNPSVLYIDDGAGYEEKVAGTSMEVLVDSAIGGEYIFQVQNTPVAKAFVKTTLTAPFALFDSATLSVLVGGEVSTHSFSTSDAVSISNATAYEVAGSINGNPTLTFSAKVVDSGSAVAIVAKADTNEDLQVEVAPTKDASVVLGLSTNRAYSIKLFKNDLLLNKDGNEATLLSNPIDSWKTYSSYTLILSVDGTVPTTTSFTDNDFISNDTGFITVGKNSIDAWVTAINAKVPGITASSDGAYIKLTSNRGSSSLASIAITGGTLVTNVGMFDVSTVTGEDSDYTMDRNSGQIELATPLSVGNRLSIGSSNTEAFTQATAVSTFTPTNAGKLWVSVDGSSSLIETGITSATSIAITTVSQDDYGNQLKLACTGAFSNVQANDVIVVEDCPYPIEGAYRINSSTSDYVTIEKQFGLTARTNHQAVALPPVGYNVSKILVMGGDLINGSDTAVISRFNGTNIIGVTNLCEIYDPNTGEVTAAAPMIQPRALFTATVLDNGKVLVVGGVDDATSSKEAIVSTEVYDPSTNTWTLGPNMPVARYGHTATTLDDHTVLITGGAYITGTAVTYLSSACIYDPAGTILPTTGTMTAPRLYHKAVCLGATNGNGGKVLIAGGVTTGNSALATVEMYDPSTGLFTSKTSSSATSLHDARWDFGMVLESDAAHVMVAGSSKHDTNDGIYKWARYSIADNLWTTGYISTSTTAKFQSKDLVVSNDGSNTVTAFHCNDYSVTQTLKFTAPATWTAEACSSLYISGYTRLNPQYVTPYNAANSYTGYVIAIGGTNPTTSLPTSLYEAYSFTGVWSGMDPVSTYTPTSPVAIAVVRTDVPLQSVSIAPNLVYTPTSLASAISSELSGASAYTYGSSNLRIATNEYQDGDISLVNQNSVMAGVWFKAGVGFKASSAIDNAPKHVACVESGNSDIGTPSFADVRILSQETSDGLSIAVDRTDISPDYSIIGAKTPYTRSVADVMVLRADNDWKSYSTIEGISAVSVGYSSIALRKAGAQPNVPHSRAYAAAPYSITPSNSLYIQIDSDLAKKFTVNLFRNLKPTSSTYGNTNTFIDSNTNGSLAKVFGLGFDFNDCAVFMRSRGLAFSGDADRKTLIRSSAIGPDGDNVRVRFSNATRPNTPVTVTVAPYSNQGTTTDLHVNLAGGALRTTLSRDTFYVGVAKTDDTGVDTVVVALGHSVTVADKADGDTNLVIKLPPGVTNSWITTGSKLWLQSTNPAFPSGIINVVTANAPVGDTQLISYTTSDLTSASGTSIGTVSYDLNGPMSFASATAVNDFVILNGSNVDTVSSGLRGTTLRVTAVDANKQYLVCSAGENTVTTGLGTALDAYQIGTASNLVVFANPAQTASAIVSAVNALSAPISLTLIGTGSGTVSSSTADEQEDRSAWYSLSDGVNWVQSTVSPVNTSGNYSLTFKDTINGALASDCDFLNEEIQIAPITAKGIVSWMNCLGVTGLSTVATINTTDNGHKVQIVSNTVGSGGSVQVQGGTANSAVAAVVGNSIGSLVNCNDGIASIPATSASGFAAGMWCSINNTHNTAKRWAGIDGTTVLSSLTADGYLTLSTPVYSTLSTPGDNRVFFERQGKYIAISQPFPFADPDSVPIGSSIFIRTADSPTSWTQTSDANKGVFRIVGVDTDQIKGMTFWIENDNAVEETSECHISILSRVSAFPGDTLSVNTNAWGSSLMGNWVVETVGAPKASPTAIYSNTHVVKLTPPASGFTPIVTALSALNNNSYLVQLLEADEFSVVAKIRAIAPNPLSSKYVDVKLENGYDFYDRVTSNAGSIITALDKLNFPIAQDSGTDGYKYNTGLIREANRIVYGDSSNSTSYPGVRAEGSRIRISGPFIKRVTISLSVRSRITNRDATDAIKSAAAYVINKTAMGKNVAISDIVRAVQGISYVSAVSVIAPLYNSMNDIIAVQASEKPMVLDLTNDISVTYVGT